MRWILTRTARLPLFPGLGTRGQILERRGEVVAVVAVEEAGVPRAQVLAPAPAHARVGVLRHPFVPSLPRNWLVEKV